MSGVDYIAWDRGHAAERGLPWPARARGVSCRTHPERADVIAVAREDLPALLDGIFHWNFHCWDAARVPLPSTLAWQAAVVTNAPGWRQETPALHLLDGAHLFVDSHDDVYLTVEGSGPSLARGAFARAFAGLVARAVEATTGRLDPGVEPAPDAVVDHFWTALPSFECRTVGATGKLGGARVAFGERGVSLEGLFGRPDFAPRGNVDYDLRTGRWVHRYR